MPEHEEPPVPPPDEPPDESEGLGPEPLSPQEKARVMDPEVLPVFDRVKSLVDSINDLPSGEERTRQEQEFDRVWAEFVNLVGEGKRINPHTVVDLMLPLKAINKPEALKFLMRHWVSLTPNSSEAQEQFGHELQSQGEYRLAEELYEQAIETQKRSLLKYRKFDVDKLLATPLEVATLEQREIPYLVVEVGDSYMHLTRVQMLQEKYNDAIESGKAAIKLFELTSAPSHTVSNHRPDVWHDVGAAYAHMSDVNETKHYLKKGLELHRVEGPKDSWISLGELTKAKGMLAAAERGPEDLSEYIQEEKQLAELLQGARDALPQKMHDLLELYADVVHYFAGREVQSEPLNRVLTDPEYQDLFEDAKHFGRDWRYFESVATTDESKKAIGRIRSLSVYLEQNRNNKLEDWSIDQFYFSMLNQPKTILMEEATDKAQMEQLIKKIDEISGLKLAEGDDNSGHEAE